MPGFDPQTAVSLAVIDIHRAHASTPTVTEACLLACPDNVNLKVELLSVTHVSQTLPADASAVTVDIEFIDDSDSDAVTTLVTAYSLKGSIQT